MTIQCELKSIQQTCTIVNANSAPTVQLKKDVATMIDKYTPVAKSALKVGADTSINSTTAKGKALVNSAFTETLPENAAIVKPVVDMSINQAENSAKQAADKLVDKSVEAGAVYTKNRAENTIDSSITVSGSLISRIIRWLRGGGNES